MLAYAEEHLSVATNERKELRIYINDRDIELQRIATEMGYRTGAGSEEMSHLVIPDPFPALALPEGFRLKSLADENLNVVVEAPGGNFVSYCGMWFEPVNRIAYVEPVATDPDYRRMGLGRAAVLEGVRRCGERGATVAYVGTAMPF